MEQYTQPEKQTGNYRLVLSTIKGTYFFLPEQIVRLEASTSYTKIYFTDHHSLLLSRVLKAYERLLMPYGFIRTHRSHLVNKNYITQVDNKGNIIMQDSSRAEVSRRKKTEVMKLLRA